jgi:hypothetical protein
MSWPGAGSPPFNNVIGLNPQLVDPENGDYRTAQGSPAAGYGCRTFRSGRRGGGGSSRASGPGAPRVGVLDVGGNITTDTTWNADLVRVHDDVTIEDGVVLHIAPGTRVEFQGDHELEVAGSLRAIGRSGQRIVFTTDEPQLFTVDRSRLGCWGGIRFEGTRATNEPSRLVFCILEYGKATRLSNGAYPYGGGALTVVDFSELAVRNCILRNNVAEYGGALFLYRNANPLIAGNLIVDNHALFNAGAIYCGYSHPNIVNNTIVGNRIHNGGNPYLDTTGVLMFLSKPLLANDIVRGNEPDLPYMHAELCGGKGCYTRYNNIEGAATGGTNIDADPLFGDRERHLAPGSPCIDAGENAAVPKFLSVDLDGEARFLDDPATPDSGSGTAPIVDIGADEYW